MSLLVITRMDEDAMPENFEIKSYTALLWLDSDRIQTSVEGRARSLGSAERRDASWSVEVSNKQGEMWFFTFDYYFIMFEFDL